MVPANEASAYRSIRLGLAARTRLDSIARFSRSARSSISPSTSASISSRSNFSQARQQLQRAVVGRGFVRIYLHLHTVSPHRQRDATSSSLARRSNCTAPSRRASVAGTLATASRIVSSASLTFYLRLYLRSAL